MSSVPPHERLPENIAYLAQLPWPTDLPPSPAARDLWPLPADPSYLEALAWAVLEDADRRRREASARLWDAYQVFGARTPEFQEAQRAWARAYAIWSEVVAIVQELLGRELRQYDDSRWP